MAACAGFCDALMDRILWGTKNDPQNRIPLWYENIGWFMKWVTAPMDYWGPFPKDAWHGIKVIRHTLELFTIIPAAYLATDSIWNIFTLIITAILSVGAFLTSKTFWYEMGLWVSPFKGFVNYLNKFDSTENERT